MKYGLIILFLFPMSISAEMSPTLENMYKDAEAKYGLPDGILAAIGTVESNNNHRAYVKEDGRGRKASFGVMQIQLATARQMGFKGNPKELLQPRVNIEYSAAYLTWLLKRSNNNIAQALTCYNAGAHHTLCKTKHYSPYVGLIFNALMHNKEEVWTNATNQ